MDIEIIGIGDEVLYGYVVNSNASFISQQLLEQGYLPARHEVVGDDQEKLKQVLEAALKRRSVVITTGGLGPTVDDWTRKIACELFGVPLEANGEIFQRLKTRYGDAFPTLDDQMMQPKGALLLENALGTASGFIMQDQVRFPDAFLIAVPGVPHEMYQMVTKQVIPYLLEKCPVKNGLAFKVLHFVDLGEHHIDPELRKLQKAFPHIIFGIYPGFSSVSVHLKVRASEEKDLLLVAGHLQERFSKNLFESPSGTLSEAVHLECLKQKITLCTAESCTGGLLAASFVKHPDASSYFLGSIVAYANSVKIEQLSVLPETLQEHGAVSMAVTQEMAQNVRKKLGADLGIAVSGIMGPSGATPSKPVGTICASIAYKDRPIFSWTEQMRGSRAMLIERSVHKLLAKLLLFLREN